MALLEMQGNLDPFQRVLTTLEQLGFRRLSVEAPGQDEKVAAAIRRGDRIPAEPVRRAIKEAMEEVWGEDMDPHSMAEACADACEDAVRHVIESGQVEGPERKTKRGDKLYDTGDLASGIVAEIER